MKVKKIFEQIETTNNINFVTGNAFVSVVFEDNGNDYCRFKKYNNFVNYLNEMYIDEVVEAVLDLEFDFKKNICPTVTINDITYSLYLESDM